MLDAEHHALIDSINVPGGLGVAIFFLVTLTETNSLPENGGPLEKEIPIGNHHF